MEKRKSDRAADRRVPRPRMRIGTRELSADNEAFVIAEIGTSHDGDEDRARRLIDAAAEAGADCAKFQIVFADEIIHPKTGEVPLPGGNVPLFERFRALERGAEFYRSLMEHTGKAGLRFLCSAFGERSARILHDLHVEALKVASPELNHLPLLREIAGYDLPLFLSTGVSMLADIEAALGVVGTRNVALLHCVTAYPAPPSDYNLRLMALLESLFGVPVGVSDHSLDPVLVPALSASLGAAAIEKHLTLSREGGGLDDPVALVAADFARMVRAVRRARREGFEETFGRLRREVGPDAVDAVLGTGIKRLAPSELENYGRTNRSLHATVDIPAGEPLTRANVAVLRTEKRLRPGIAPRYYETVLGTRAERRIPAGEGITWKDLLSE